MHHRHSSTSEGTSARRTPHIHSTGLGTLGDTAAPAPSSSLTDLWNQALGAVTPIVQSAISTEFATKAQIQTINAQAATDIAKINAAKGITSAAATPTTMPVTTTPTATPWYKNPLTWLIVAGLIGVGVYKGRRRLRRR